MKLLGVVTTYHPTLEELTRNINTYISELDQLVIWDNTPGGCGLLDYVIESTNNPKITIRRSGNNDFLAKPFNICIKEAIENDFTHILTMDQDSFFEENNFIEFRNLVSKHQDPKVMIYTSAKSENKRISLDEIEVNNAITSGTIYKLEVFKKIGYFIEDFLIYMIDIEFGMRVRKYNYKILCFQNIVLNHQTGYSISKFGVHLNMYSAQSTYYIIRNTILTWKLYPENFKATEKYKFYKYKVFYRTIKMIFEPNKFLKLKGIYLGLLHGWGGKAGNYEL